MSEAAVVNGNQAITEQQYRQMCKQVRQFQLANGKKRKAKPVLKALGETSALTKTLTIQKAPVDWDDLSAGMLFSLDPAGTLIYTKVGKDRALCLNTMKSQSVGGASTYRIFL